MKLFLLALFSLCIAADDDERIFDSSITRVERFPWIASIRLLVTTHQCSAVIISDRYVLTAASCTQQLTFLTNFLTVKAGVDDLFSVNDSREQSRSVVQIILHPNFIASQPDRNNLALIRLNAAWNFSSPSVSKIPLSNLTSVAGMNLTTVGWGISLQQNSSIPMALLQQVILMENLECSRNKTADPLTQLCASGRRCSASSFRLQSSRSVLLGTCRGLLESEVFARRYVTS